MKDTDLKKFKELLSDQDDRYSRYSMYYRMLAIRRAAAQRAAYARAAAQRAAYARAVAARAAAARAAAERAAAERAAAIRAAAIRAAAVRAAAIRAAAIRAAAIRAAAIRAAEARAAAQRAAAAKAAAEKAAAAKAAAEVKAKEDADRAAAAKAEEEKAAAEKAAAEKAAADAAAAEAKAAEDERKAKEAEAKARAEAAAIQEAEAKAKAKAAADALAAKLAKARAEAEARRQAALARARAYLFWRKKQEELARIRRAAAEAAAAAERKRLADIARAKAAEEARKKAEAEAARKKAEAARLKKIAEEAAEAAAKAVKVADVRTAEARQTETIYPRAELMEKTVEKLLEKLDTVTTKSDLEDANRQFSSVQTKVTEIANELRKLENWQKLSDPVTTPLIVAKECDTAEDSTWPKQRAIIVKELQTGYDMVKLFDHTTAALHNFHGGTYSGINLYGMAYAKFGIEISWHLRNIIKGFKVVDLSLVPEHSSMWLVVKAGWGKTVDRLERYFNRLEKRISNADDDEKIREVLLHFNALERQFEKAASAVGAELQQKTFGDYRAEYGDKFGPKLTILIQSFASHVKVGLENKIDQDSTTNKVEEEATGA